MQAKARRLLGHFYDQNRGWVDGTTRFAEMVRKRLRPGMLVLDLGAGPGKEGPVNFRQDVETLVGIDPDRAIKRNMRVHCRLLGKAGELPFRTETFDLVYCDWVAEHLEAPLAACEEVFRVLKRGGAFLFRTGNIQHYSYAIAAHTPHWFHRLVANRARGLPSDGGEPYPTYYRMNTRRHARRILASAGFEEEELFTVEAEPSYLIFSSTSFLLGVAYERLVNGIELLAGFRACLFGCFRKRLRTQAEEGLGV